MSTSMFENIVGQERLKKSIEVAIVASLKKKTLLDHIIVTGEGGLGKTLLLEEIAKELNCNLVQTQGSRFKNPTQIREFLIEHTKWINGKSPFIIIDEVHQMSVNMQEELYIPMSDFKILPDISLPPFTLAVATTRPDKLDYNSFVKRFSHEWKLNPLSQQEIMFLLSRYFAKKNVECWYPSIEKIASRSRGIPRQALSYASKAYLYSVYNNHKEVTIGDVDEAFSELGIDELGLNHDQRRYLQILSTVEVMSIRDLAARLGKQSDEIVKETIEPLLVNLGLVRSTSRGRALSPSGIRYITGKSAPKLAVV